MCLHIKRVNQYPPKLKVAKEDITAYKVLDKVEIDDDKFFVTTYRQCKVETQVVTALGNYYPELVYNKYLICGGVIHCFKRQEDAENLITSDNMFRDSFVVKITIPKGTNYIEGVDDYGKDSICAKKIIYDCEPSELYNNRVYPK